ncbi:MAG: TldD/PmbA family protein, partial [Clostridium sp.]
MISKELTHEVLKEALSTGADFSEIYIEEEDINTALISNGKVEDVLSGKTYGAGIRVFSGFRSVYVHTNNVSREGLLKCARDASSAIEGKGCSIQDLVINNKSNISPIIYSPDSVNISKKVNVIKRAYTAAKEYSPEIVQVMSRYSDNDKRVYIANSEGLISSDRRCRTRVAIQSVASDGTENQTGFFGPGKSSGFEFFNEIDIEWYAREASRMAVTMLHADKCPSGTMDVVIDNGFGGVIFHEACGHSLEATSVAKGHSV